MTDLKKITSATNQPGALCADEPVFHFDMRHVDIKPMLKVLGGLCLFFGAMAVVAGLGALVVVAVRSLIRWL